MVKYFDFKKSKYLNMICDLTSYDNLKCLLVKRFRKVIKLYKTDVVVVVKVKKENKGRKLGKLNGQRKKKGGNEKGAENI